MKKNNISGFFAALVMGSALFAASCEKPSGETPVPEFPQLIEKTVAPGESVTIPVQANMDWEISVPENGLQWFWIQDGAFQLYRLSGKAGEAELSHSKGSIHLCSCRCRWSYISSFICSSHF